MSAQDTNIQTTAEVLPQSGGSYIRQPDGTLVEQKPKVEIADLVAAKRGAAEQPAKPTQE